MDEEQNNNPEIDEPEIGEVDTEALAVRGKEPVTLDSLAQGAEDFVETYTGLLVSCRHASIAMTEPEDWVLFRRPAEDGQEARVTAYLQDSGAQRIEDLWKIEVTPCKGARDFQPTRVTTEGSDDYAWTLTGDGVARLFSPPKRVFAIEGVRRSDEDFVKYKKGIQQELEVKKAAFANLHGGIVRRLTGLGSVSASLLEEVWKNAGMTRKKIEHCAKGKGYGSRNERMGEAGDFGAAPSCPQCKRTMVLRQGKKGPFWGCPGYPKCTQKPIDAVPVTKAAKPARSEEAPPPDEPGAEKHGAPAGVDPVASGKNKLLERIKGKPWEREVKPMLVKATTTGEILDIQTIVLDREKEAAK